MVPTLDSRIKPSHLVPPPIASHSNDGSATTVTEATWTSDEEISRSYSGKYPIHDDTNGSTKLRFWILRILYMNGFLADDWGSRTVETIAFFCTLAFVLLPPAFEDLFFFTLLVTQLFYSCDLFPDMANHENYYLVVCLVLLPHHVHVCLRQGMKWFGRIGLGSQTQSKTARRLDRSSDTRNGSPCNDDTVKIHETVNTAKWLVIILYFFAGFHKLNRDFFDVDVTCSFEMVDRLLEPLHLQVYHDFPLWLQNCLPVLVIFLELVPALLFACVPSWHYWAIAMLLSVHGPLSLVGFADFSAIGMVNMFVFVPPTVVAQEMPRKRYFATVTIGLALVRFGLKYLKEQYSAVDYKTNTVKVADAVEGLLLIMAFIPVWIPYFRTKISTNATVCPPRQWWNRAMALVFVFFCMNNYLGLRTTGTASMFSNLRTEGNSSNHFLLASNPIKVFDYQEDLVFVVDADERIWELYRYQFNPAVWLPWIQFCRNVEQAIADQHPQVYLKVHYQGLDYETHDLSFDRNFTAHFTIPWWQSKYFEFREILEPDQKQECFW